MRKIVHKTQEKVGYQRNSNLELFRIITMLFIVAHHYVANSGIAASDGPIFADLWSAKSVFLLVFGAFGKTGINCFVLITGYFMCTSRITAKKFAKIILEVEFYRLGIYFLFLITGYEAFSISGFINAFLPVTVVEQNFVGCYLLFYLMIPFLNIAVQNMNEKQHIKLVLLLCFVYVMLGTIYSRDVHFNYMTWFSVLYFVASYIRLYPKKIYQKTGVWAVLTLGMLLVSALSVVVCTYIVQYYNAGGVFYFVEDCNKILAFATAVCCFMFFKNVNIKQNKFINTVAASTFGILLIHANSPAMRRFVWNDLLNVVPMYDSKLLVPYAFASVIGIFVVCAFIDYLRIRVVEKPFFNLWDKHWPRIVEKYTDIENKACKKLGITIGENKGE